MTNEKQGRSGKGWAVVAIHVLMIIALIWLFLSSALANQWSLMTIVAEILLVVVVCLILPMGYFTLQPNEAKVLVLFGRYKGTIRSDGFHWTNPLQLAQPRGKYTVSQRIRLSLIHI